MGAIRLVGIARALEGQTDRRVLVQRTSVADDCATVIGVMVRYEPALPALRVEGGGD